MTVTASPPAKYSRAATHSHVFARLVDSSGNEIGDGDDYEVIAASDTDEPVGIALSRLRGILVVPATTSPGTVTIEDGAGTTHTLFTGGADSILTLHPFYIPLGPNGIVAVTEWQITTGANVSVIAFGDFD